MMSCTVMSATFFSWSRLEEGVREVAFAAYGAGIFWFHGFFTFIHFLYRRAIITHLS